MQFHTFINPDTGQNLGYVIHKIDCFGYRSTASAWFDANGRMIDGECFDAKGRGYNIPLTSPMAFAVQQRCNHLLPADNYCYPLPKWD